MAWFSGNWFGGNWHAGYWFGQTPAAPARRDDGDRAAGGFTKRRPRLPRSRVESFVCVVKCQKMHAASFRASAVQGGGSVQAGMATMSIATLGKTQVSGACRLRAPFERLDLVTVDRPSFNAHLDDVRRKTRNEVEEELLLLELV